MCNVASSIDRFVKLLESRPGIVKYVRKLTYKLDDYYHYISYQTRLENDDYRLSPILLNFLRTIPRLNCLTITAEILLIWDILDPSLTSSFLHLMHLPTINHIDLSLIYDFPLFSLTSSVNLHRLDLFCMYGPCENFVQSETMPQIREFHTSHSSSPTMKLLHVKRQDGRPAFNFIDFRRLEISFTYPNDEQNLQYLLQNAKLLEELHLSVGFYQHWILSTFSASEAS